MPSPYLTKSDFKACFDCRTKLFYRKNSYPTSIDENEYIKFLADGGFMIETVAKAQYPYGIDLVAERDPQTALKRTQDLLAARPDAVVFEAAVIFGKYYARIDILRREGNTLHLIEVKSSSINTENEDDPDDATSAFLGKQGKNKGRPNAKWRPYLLDVAFQAYVLRQAFPGYTVKPWLCVVDKAHRAVASETLDKFRVTRDESNPKSRPDVTYLGKLSDLLGSKLLTNRHVTSETDMLMPEVEAKAKVLAALIDAKGGVQRVQEPVTDFYKVCRKCEYRFKSSAAPQPHGFSECWKGMADAKPHILDLHRVTQIGTSKFPDPVPDLLQQGDASLLDLREDQLGKEGVWQVRRHIQWSHSGEAGQEYLPEVLKNQLRSHATAPGWPFHFLDFEACNVSLPHHAGLRPYERVAFQWSCHTLDRQGLLTHSDWLNTGRYFPNFAFAQSLREQIGDKGTIYVWSSYEATTLQRVLTQITEWVKREAVEAVKISGLASLQELDRLVDWIDQLIA